MESVERPVKVPRKKRRVWIWLLVIAVAIGTVLVLQHVNSRPATTNAFADPPAVPVTATAAHQGDIRVYVEALGTVTPVYTVSVTSRVVGQIMSVNYQEGQLVHKDDSLLEIDPRPYQAALTQVQGQLAHDQGVLNEARIDLERYQQAFARNAIAKQQLDDQQQVVTQDEGTVGNDQGQVENAKLNLIYCHISSPIDGRVGLRLVDPGNVVQANGTSPLVVVTQLQPITVIFSVAEDYLPQIQQQMRSGTHLVVDAYDRTQEKKIAEGALMSIDNEINTTTGTVNLRALFPNQDSSLFPNQFVNARLLLQTQHEQILVPSAAIQRNAQGAYVYVVGPDQKASLRTVTVGTTDGNTVAVDGVKPGENVVTKGFDKLQDGVKVSVLSASGAAGASSGVTTP